MPHPGRVLGIDVGTRRVGLACSDPSRIVAGALPTLPVPPAGRTSPGDREPAARPPTGESGESGEAGEAGEAALLDRLADRLASVAAEQSCDTVVVGLPRSLAGRETDATRHARSVAQALEARGLHVELWDERLSSVEAERLLLSAGRRRAQRKEERDAIAATLILQGWLDAQRRS